VSVEQLSEVIIDEHTILPGYIDRAKLRSISAHK
jgi:hypothetical protein